jgi:hypothetical protein
VREHRACGAVRARHAGRPKLADAVLAWYRDDAGTAELADVRAAYDGGRFQRVEQRVPHFGFTTKAHWLTFSVDRVGGTPWVLRLSARPGRNLPRTPAARSHDGARRERQPRSGEGELERSPLPGSADEVLLIPLFGHTHGHAGVALRTGKGWLLHAGNAYFSHPEQLGRNAPLGLEIFQRAIAMDGRQRLHNRARLTELVRNHSDEVTVICAHDRRVRARDVITCWCGSRTRSGPSP